MLPYERLLALDDAWWRTLTLLLGYILHVSGEEQPHAFKYASSLYISACSAWDLVPSPMMVYLGTCALGLNLILWGVSTWLLPMLCCVRHLD